MEVPPINLLIVDDEPNILAGLASGLKSHSVTIFTAVDGEQAEQIAGEEVIHILLTDMRLPGRLNGIDLIRLFREKFPEISVMAITAFATVETAVEAMRLGAFDFISKPIDLDLIRHQVGKAITHQQLLMENHQLREQLSHAGSISGLIGNSETTRQIARQIRQVADTDATVMILGESGTGKEVTARAIHNLSHRKAHPFMPVNMGALPESLIESELFGHEKGAFTDARKQKAGYFETAQGGTLFLDEITETTPKTQIALLRVLEQREFRRVGGDRFIPFNTRIISASNRDVDELVQKGTFREDLYYRLNIVPLFLPPLRNRREDIPVLADHFMSHFCSRHGRPLKSLSNGAMDVLCSRMWPGNIRQLRNLMERLAVTVHGDTVQMDDIPPERSPQEDIVPSSLQEAVEAAEKTAILNALQECMNHREKTAERLKISIRTLHYKMSRYGLS